MMAGGVLRRTLRMGCGSALGLLLVAGCGGSEERPAGSAEADPLEAAEAAEMATAAEARAEEGGGSAPSRAANGPGEDGERAEAPAGDGAREQPSTAEVATPGFEEPGLRTYRLRLVNPGSDDAVVHASAGAGSVVLDTVRAGDSTRVNVEVRSDRLLLEASGVDGETLGSEELELSPEELSRWVVPAASG